jgi:hypothetical protein
VNPQVLSGPTGYVESSFRFNEPSLRILCSPTSIVRSSNWLRFTRFKRRSPSGSASAAGGWEQRAGISR